MHQGARRFELCILVWLALALSASEGFATADGPDHWAVQGVAADDVLNIRSEPTAASDKIGEIPHDGRALDNLGCVGQPSLEEWTAMSADERRKAALRRWCKIRYGDTVGWVAGRYLMEDGAPVEPQDQEQ